MKPSRCKSWSKNWAICDTDTNNVMIVDNVARLVHDATTLDDAAIVKDHDIKNKNKGPWRTPCRAFATMRG